MLLQNKNIYNPRIQRWNVRRSNHLKWKPCLHFQSSYVAHKILHFAIVRLFDRSFASIRYDVTKILRFFFVPGKHRTKRIVSW